MDWRGKATVMICMAIAPIGVRAQISGGTPPLTVHLWPASYPEIDHQNVAEHNTTTAKDSLIGGRTVVRLGDVSDPTITVYRPNRPAATRAAVIVIPGGGYYILAIDLEGEEICRWLNARGITAILLKYRVPTRAPHTQALNDTERAVKLVRARAAEWNIDSNRIGVMGFSAGGDLAARISTNCANAPSEVNDKISRLSCCPDFAMLIYPAYLTLNAQSVELASDLHVSSATPPSFLVQAQDDPVGVMNSIGYYTALTRSGVPSELHIYSKGGHGYGLRPSKNEISTWPARLEDWLRSIDVIPH